ncbi:hypothetical protein [Streptomyces sp. NBC_01716]|uniref:hypothetical protein n=1 Tax=Streptomyces sp. NBC_01716 TaxID=2975917 RepID=UPI002E306B53|nr:hypothetical protein [Streptomyces sp. NBC_01716]
MNIVMLTSCVLLVALGGCDRQSAPPRDAGAASEPAVSDADRSAFKRYWDRMTAYKNEYASCLRSRGIGGVSVKESSVEFPTTEQNNEKASSAQRICRSKVAYPEDPDDEVRRGMYAAAVGSYQCLTEGGWKPRKPPSLSAYLADGAQWTPYSELPVNDAEWERLNKQCPQFDS